MAQEENEYEGLPRLEKYFCPTLSRTDPEKLAFSIFSNIRSRKGMLDGVDDETQEGFLNDLVSIIVQHPIKSK